MATDAIESTVSIDFDQYMVPALEVTREATDSLQDGLSPAFSTNVKLMRQKTRNTSGACLVGKEAGNKAAKEAHSDRLKAGVGLRESCKSAPTEVGSARVR